jgi:hypothetical protein
VKSWSIIFATIVIFGAGVITGGLLVNHIEPLQPVHHSNNNNPTPQATNGTMPMPQRAIVLNEQLVQQLNEKLDLTPAQSQQIKKIIETGQQRNRDLWKLVAPQMQLVLRDTRQQIRQVLTPDQRKQFEALMKAQRHPPSTNAPPEVPGSSTNMPPVEMSTNAPAVEPPVPTNAPGV